jgi:hypothetical protein
VLDQAGDVLLVLDDEYAMPGHAHDRQYRPEVSLPCRGC